MKKQTINDVARISGVGKATVSRVFSGSPLVADETRRRVTAAAESVGYRPNPIARALTTSRTRNICIVVPNIQSFVMSRIVRGAMLGARQKGYSLFVLDSGEDTVSGEQAPDLAELLHEQAGEGVIFCYESAREKMEQIAAGRPILFLESEPRHRVVDTIRTDNRTGMELLIQHLHALGHSRIAGVFGGKGDYSADRHNNFQRAMKTVWLDPSEELMIFSNWAIEDGYRDFIRLMNLPDDKRPTAIVYVSDLMAMGAIRAAAELGTAVPGKVSIAGTDDSSTGSYLVPSLTTLSFDPHTMGISAAQQLIERIENPGMDPRTTLIPVSLKIRESTGPAET
jgi:LacI family transcriptional regulator